MSYNILADRLATQYHHKKTPTDFLHLQFRGPRILAEIRQSNADIICLQELDRVSDFYDQMFSALGYKLVHYPRPGIFRNEGIAIAYNHQKLKLLKLE